MLLTKFSWWLYEAFPTKTSQFGLQGASFGARAHCPAMGTLQAGSDLHHVIRPDEGQVSCGGPLGHQLLRITVFCVHSMSYGIVTHQ